MPLTGKAVSQYKESRERTGAGGPTMMRFKICAAVLSVLLMPVAPVLASDHMDFHRQQCNSTTAALAAQVRGCSKIAGSDRFEAAAKGIAYYNMGVAYGGNEQLKKAVESYTKALKLNPGDAEAAFNRDLALRALKEPGKKPGGQPNGKKEIARTDLPEDMRRTTSSQKAAQKKQAQKAQEKRTIKKQTKAKRTRAERKKVE
ncbi:MAG: hypothetical protein CMM60_05170 [Rhodospirillaceae bacterium]|nr:hypothetical protein [Rhodospirillaceae bacterium]